MTTPYPPSWPKPAFNKPKAIATRITEAQKLGMYNRTITTREVAKSLGVREAYLSHLFPGKVPVDDITSSKRALNKIRKEFRYQQARLVLEGRFTITQAASNCRIHYRSMARAVQALKLALETSTGGLDHGNV